MAGLGLTVSPGFLLLGAALYYMGGWPAAAAFLAAGLAHELGHLTALFLAGAAVRGVRITACGPVIDYSGVLTRRQEAGIIAAGPVAGLLFAVCCFITDIPFLRYAGAIALLGTAFNLLPVLPMDGGRLAQYGLELVMKPQWASAVLRIAGSLCALGVLVTGLHIRSVAAAAVGIWMAALANVPELR
ncbi:MAG: hypothetical protein LUH36_03360 [Oscillospiraceae bacterium]|nr:hypothetical protein [Oscillospiraceae bacterium]